MLVNCPECSKGISSLASFCPKCGYPVEELGFGKTPDEKPETPADAAGSEDNEDFQRERFKAKFHKVAKEIEIIREKNRIIEGWVFRTHRYAEEQLLQSEHFAKMDSVIGKIGDDAKQWFIAGKTTGTAEKIYHELRKQILSDISALKQEISERPPTWWESVIAFVKSILLRIGV